MKERYQKIGDTKRFTTNEMLCEGYPRQFLVYMRTVRQMEFAQEPDVRILTKNFFILMLFFKIKKKTIIFSMMDYVGYFIMH